jgi:hypothetical protein
VNRPPWWLSERPPRVTVWASGGTSAAHGALTPGPPGACQIVGILGTPLTRPLSDSRRPRPCLTPATSGSTATASANGARSRPCRSAPNATEPSPAPVAMASAQSAGKAPLPVARLKPPGAAAVAPNRNPPAGRWPRGPVKLKPERA